jgi:hypothetical protein
MSNDSIQNQVKILNFNTKKKTPRNVNIFINKMPKTKNQSFQVKDDI